MRANKSSLIGTKRNQTTIRGSQSLKKKIIQEVSFYEEH
nr:MAG TPA: hypothetical protein [Caudoviricetes sp.]